MPGFYDELEKNIQKYGGEDEAYKIKLKNEIRNSLGYSNYISQRDRALKKPLDLSLMKGNITPAGVKQLVGGAMDIKQQGVETYQTMAEKTDIAAGQIAADRIAKERAAATAARSKMGLENGVAFMPNDELDTKILQYMQNPTNADGSIKTPEQFQTEMNEYFKGRDTVTMGSPTPEGGLQARAILDANAIQQRVSQRMPADYLQNQDKYMLMARGYSEKQAKENAGALRYSSGQMKEPEKLIFETQNPSMAKLFQENQNLGSLIKDATQVESVKDPKTGQDATYPTYTFTELKQKYPDIQLDVIKQQIEPLYRKGAVEDIESYLEESGGMKKKGLFGIDKLDWLAPDEPIRKIDIFKSVYNKEDTSAKFKDGGFDAVTKTSAFKELKNTLTADYGDLYSSEEINRILFNIIIERM